MILVPQCFRDDVLWLWNRLDSEPEAPKFATEAHVLCAMLWIGLLDHRQAHVFASCGDAPWLRNVPADDYNAQMAALAGRFEEPPADKRPSPRVVRLSRKRYPLHLPPSCEANFRRFAADLGRSPEATLCALLSVAIASMRGELAKTDPGAELERLAA
jgi:hypothetical protein